jgi:hypothetical protein
MPSVRRMLQLHKWVVPRSEPVQESLAETEDPQTLLFTTHSSSTYEDKTSTLKIVAVTRRDSDLEAFSHNPTDGSFAPLIGRSST